jgi:hypothetical protein
VTVVTVAARASRRKKNLLDSDSELESHWQNVQ